MKKLIALIAVFFFVPVQQVSAHAEGLTPFLQINGEYPEIHPIQEESLVPKAFSVPEDIAKESYLVNEEIEFTIDTSVLSKVYSEEVLNTIVYEWELGDGSIKEGTNIKHKYSSMGSKVLTIYARFNDPSVELPPQPIETVQVNIIPDRSYKIPEPVIRANKKDLSRDSHEVNMQIPVAYEAVIKNQPSADIVSYSWDFGEGGKGSEQKVVYKYTTDPAMVAPVLKVTDKNGFTAYTFGILTNGKGTAGYTFATNTVGMIILGVQAIIVVVGVFWFMMVVRSKKKKK
jgi:hypothetical protein